MCRTIYLLWGVSVIGFVASLGRAGVISVDFAPTGKQTQMGADEVAGVVPASHWNSFTETTLGSGVYKPLRDHSGAVITGAGINWYSPSVMNTAAPDTAGDSRMMRGGLYTSGSMTVLINLPSDWAATGYKLILYGDTPGTGPTTGQIFGVKLNQAAAGQTGNQFINDEGVDFSGDYIASDGVLHWSSTNKYQPLYESNYYQYNNLTSTTLTLSVFPGQNTGGSNWRAALNGLQLVQVPEPASLSMLGVAGGLLLVRRRGKNGRSV
jgi:hypothetical protein